MVAIATGLWWDYSKPSILAATITLPIDAGGYLLSGLTLLVSIAGASFWNIVAFLLHHWRATGLPASTVYVQHQACLRNSANAVRAIWEALKIHHAWAAKRPDRLVFQTCLVVIPAFLVWACFSTAALFTSSITNKAYASVVARVEPQNCGFWSFNTTTDEGRIAFARMRTADTIQARSYASNFYANTTSSPVRPVFSRSTLPYSVHRSAPCPIPAVERCLLGPDKALRIESDFLNSHEMMGINARPEDRVTAQINLTCSPVHVKDLQRRSPGTVGKDNVVIDFLLGPIIDVWNYTYQYKTAAANNTGVRYNLYAMTSLGLSLGPLVATPWVPIPDFTRTDADISVHFLSQNDVLYISPVYDPWFSANGTYNATTSDGKTFISSDDWVRVMVCAEQYVVCNPVTSQCSSPAGFAGLVGQLPALNRTLGFNKAQQAAADRMAAAMGKSSVYNTVADLGSQALWASNFLMGNLSPGLPDDHWQTEVFGWFHTGLAHAQASILDFAYTSVGVERLGPGVQALGRNPSERQLIVPETKGGEEYLRQCSNQLVQAVDEVQNFSFCGVLVIVLGSAAIVLLDCCLERIVDGLSGPDSVAKRAREADSKLHLLRMALTRTPEKESGWEPGSWAIPVRDAADLVEEPTLSARFASYPRSSDSSGPSVEFKEAIKEDPPELPPRKPVAHVEDHAVSSPEFLDGRVSPER